MADISQYVPRLPFDTLAQFEAVSGLMILNVDLKAFEQSRVNYAANTPNPDDIELYSTINHETYHFFQTVATGYQYAYALEMWQLIEAEGNLEVRRNRFQRWKNSIRAKAFQAYSLFRLSSKVFKQFLGFEALVRDFENAQAWENSSQNDLSVLSARNPSLARGFDRLWAKIEAPGAGGLSAIELIEGSAIVFQHLLTQGRAGLKENLATAWDATGSTYRKAFEVAEAKCGARALDILLPAAALALRYSYPPEAYLVFLERLNASSPGDEVAAARALASDPPGISDAGGYLGTALDVRRKQLTGKTFYSVYDDFLDKLEKRAWGFDEIELLSAPGPAQKIDSFAVVTVVKEGPLRTYVDSDMLVRRLLCASLVLRAAKLPRYRRDAEKRLMERMHPIVARLFNPVMAAEEYNQLGLKYLDQGDTDQAETMLSLALSIFRSHQHQQGIARQLYNLGLVYAQREDEARAQEMYRSSLMIAEEIEDSKMIAQAAANLGHEYMKMKVPRLEEAETLIRKALKIEEGMDLKEGMAIDYANLGRIYYAQKNSNQAREFFTKAEELYRAVGDDSMANSIEVALASMDKAKKQGQA